MSSSLLVMSCRSLTIAMGLPSRRISEVAAIVVSGDVRVGVVFGGASQATEVPHGGS